MDAGDSDQNELSYFDKSTGQVQPIVRFQTPAQSWGTEFSPDSRFLYIGGWSLPSEKIYQYDLYNLDPSIFVLSYKFIADYEGGALQIGRDGKIYVCRDGTDWLGVINDPSASDTACHYQQDGVSLSGKTCRRGLPNFIQTYFLRFEYTGTCAGQVFSFTSNFNPVPDQIIWDFGDGNSTSGITASHVYLNGGNFIVTATALYATGGTAGTVVAQRNITVAGLPQPNLGPDLTVCKGTSIQLSPGSFTSYLWNTGVASPTLTIADTGYYWVEVVNDTGCINRDTLHLSWFRQPTIDESNMNIAPTTCNAATGAITGLFVDGLQPLTITWKNGGGTILGHDPDLYHLPVDNYFLSVTDSAGCTTQLKTYTIKNVGDSLILSVDRQDSHCSLNNGSITVNATAGLTDMLFYAIDTNHFVANGGLFTGLPPGSYQVWVKDSLGCKKYMTGTRSRYFNSPGPRCNPSSRMKSTVSPTAAS